MSDTITVEEPQIIITPDDPEFYPLIEIPPDRLQVLEAIYSQYPQHLVYKMLLAQPEWDIRADQVKAAAGWKCEFCGSDRQLQAHHKVYLLRDFMEGHPKLLTYPDRPKLKRYPWDYPRKYFMCLCDPHHDGVTFTKIKLCRGDHPNWEVWDRYHTLLVGLGGLFDHERQKDPKVRAIIDFFIDITKAVSPEARQQVGLENERIEAMLDLIRDRVERPL